MLPGLPDRPAQNWRGKKALSQYDHLVKTVGDDYAHELAKIQALVRFHYKEDPDTMSDERLGRLWGELQFVLAWNAKNQPKM